MLRRLPERTYAAAAGAFLRSVPALGEGRAAVLMYHNVCRLPQRSAPFYQHVLPHQFAEQMALLAEGGYRVVELGRLVAMLEAGRPLPARLVAITFDDGYADLLSVWGHLERRGFPATIFLATGFMDRPGFEWLERGEGAAYRALAAGAIRPLGWAEVRELAERGAGFGSHGVSHRPLEALNDAQLLAELTVSRDDIEWRLSRPVRLFSVPFACPETSGFRTRLAGALRRAGYRGAVTTALGRAGRGADVCFLPRLPVNALDTLASFEAKLRGAYDWLRPIQRAYKLWLKPRLQRSAAPPPPDEATPEMRGTS